MSQRRKPLRNFLTGLTELKKVTMQERERVGAVPKDHWTAPLLVPAGSVTLLMFVLIDKYIGL